MNLNRLSTPQRLAGACMIVVAISAFLPWVSIFGIGVTGIHGDGRMTLLFALVGLVVLALSTDVVSARKLGSKPATIILAIASVLTALVGLADMNGAAAAGLYLTLFAGLGWVVATAWDHTARKRAAEPTLDELPAESRSHVDPSGPAGPL